LAKIVEDLKEWDTQVWLGILLRIFGTVITKSIGIILIIQNIGNNLRIKNEST
jgi:hypothetical protein